MKTKYNRKKFKKGKFLFSFANLQNAIGEKKSIKNNFRGRSAKRVYQIQIRSEQNIIKREQNKTEMRHYITFLINNYQERKINYFIKKLEISSREDD